MTAPKSNYICPECGMFCACKMEKYCHDCDKYENCSFRTISNVYRPPAIPAKEICYECRQKAGDVKVAAFA